MKALVDQIIPPDAWPGGWDGGVAELLEREPLTWARPLLDRAPRDTRSVAQLERDDPEAFAALARVCFEGYYAAARGFTPRAWDMLGFPGHADASSRSRSPVVDAPRDAYDVVVVGAGAGGGVTACVLAEAGLRVLLVERARAAHAGRAARRPPARQARAALRPGRRARSGPSARARRRGRRRRGLRSRGRGG